VLAFFFSLVSLFLSCGKFSGASISVAWVPQVGCCPEEGSRQQFGSLFLGHFLKKIYLLDIGRLSGSSLGLFVSSCNEMGNSSAYLKCTRNMAL